MPVRPLLLLVLCWLGAAPAEAQMSNFLRDKGYQVRYETEGSGVYYKDAPLPTWLLVINVRQYEVRQLFTPAAGIAGLSTPANAPGLYYQSSKSPFFARQAYQAAIAATRGCFALVNGAFFEQYNDVTQLSFPVKFEGRIATGGSSLYGPVAKPAAGYYRRIKLLALVFGPDTVAIQPYGTAHRNVLQAPAVKNALVSFNYVDHPARVMAHDYQTRFLLAGTLGLDQQPGDEWLVVATARGRIEQLAQQMRELSIVSPLLSLDGGTSVLMHQATLGTLHKPGLDRPHPDSLSYAKVPHYLYFTKKE